MKRAAEEEEVGCLWALSMQVLVLVLAFANVTLLLFSIRKRWRQKSRRQRKMGIRKRQKWRLRFLSCYLFAALSYQPGQHRVVELVLFCIFGEKFLFVCSHVITLHWSLET